MKTYILTVLEADYEDLVTDILAALHKQGIINYSEVSEAPSSAVPDSAKNEQEILPTQPPP